MDIPIKFILAYFIIYLIVSTTTAYLYIEEGEEMPEAFTNLTKGKEGFSLVPIVGDITHAMGKLWDLFSIFLIMFTFSFPHMPLILSFIMTIINIILLIALIIAIYPFIKGLIDSAIAFLDSVTPFT